MSRFRYVKGTITKITGGDHNIYSRNGNINFIAAKKVNSDGLEGGQIYTNNPIFPKPLEIQIPTDFDIQLDLIEEDFVPLGIADYDGKVENGNIRFKIIVSGNGINEWELKIKYKGNIIYESYSATVELDEVTITGKGNSRQNPTNQNNTSNSVTRFWPAGEYLLEWGGFDKNGNLNTSILKEELEAELMGKAEQNTRTAPPLLFTLATKKHDWIDIQIDKNTLEINAHLGVDISDGGDKGLNKSHKVSQNAINHYRQTPISQRTRSYTQLEQLALSGIEEYWSRNGSRGNNIGNDVTIDTDSYKVSVFATQSSKDGLRAPKIIYRTNKSSGRSRNWELSRILYYNVGYIEYSNGWGYIYFPDDDFMMTSAHEIGHEILKYFGGHKYSKSHKESSTILTQDDLGIPLPATGEIDLMMYYNANYDMSRTIASEKDVLGLLWCSKMQTKKL